MGRRENNQSQSVDQATQRALPTAQIALPDVVLKYAVTSQSSFCRTSAYDCSLRAQPGIYFFIQQKPVIHDHILAGCFGNGEFATRWPFHSLNK